MPPEIVMIIILLGIIGGFITAFIVQSIMESRKYRNLMICLFPSADRHEKEGDCTCSSCGKKFIRSFRLCTQDVVANLNRPENLTETHVYCPHCGHDEMISYTPINSLNVYIKENWRKLNETE